LKIIFLEDFLASVTFWDGKTNKVKQFQYERGDELTNMAITPDMFEDYLLIHNNKSSFQVPKNIIKIS
jgi:hypothetical protein